MSDYARQKLWEALSALVGAGTIQERLMGAGMQLVVLQPRGLLSEHLEEFRAIMHELTRCPAVGNEGTLAATTRTLTDDQGRAIAIRILELYTGVRGGI